MILTNSAMTTHSLNDQCRIYAYLNDKIAHFAIKWSLVISFARYFMEQFFNSDNRKKDWIFIHHQHKQSTKTPKQPVSPIRIRFVWLAFVQYRNLFNWSTFCWAIEHRMRFVYIAYVQVDVIQPLFRCGIF